MSEMKKIFIASAIVIAMTMTTTPAMATLGDAASNGQVQFLGTVAAKTCDVVVDSEGAVNNLIQFGRVNKNESVDKYFTVKLKDPTCVDNMTKAHFLWASPAFTTAGLGNQSGQATDAIVELKAVSDGNTTTNTALITSANNAVTFELIQGKVAEGFKYNAKFVAGNAPGNFETAAAYSIVYE
jgi:type 1 fimbria pilin